MPDRSARVRLAMWMTATIAVACILALALVVALGMYVWAHAVPPLEAEPTSEGLRITVNRALLRDVQISVDHGVPVTLAELSRGDTVLPWSDFGLAASPTLHDEVRRVDATGMSRFSRFQTTLSFSSATPHTSISQTLNYVSSAE